MGYTNRLNICLTCLKRVSRHFQRKELRLREASSDRPDSTTDPGLGLCMLWRSEYNQKSKSGFMDFQYNAAWSIMKLTSDTYVIYRVQQLGHNY